MTFAGFLLNRVQAVPSGPFPTEVALHEVLPAEWAIALARLPAQATARAFAHRQSARELIRAAGGAPIWLLPEIPGGISSIQGLEKLVPSLPPMPPTVL